SSLNSLISHSHYPWPTLDEGCRYGLAGDIIGLIGPHTEADPAALLLQFHAAFGNAVGRSPYFRSEGDRHCTNLFITLVGETAKGRKGTSWAYPRRIVGDADPTWQHRIASGLSSGEGLIWQVRDKIEKAEAQKDGSIDIKTIDPGVDDKRLLAYE